MTQNLAKIRAAIAAGHVDQARELLREEVAADPSADAYYLCALVAVTSERKRALLGKALERDPFHTEAAAALTQMNPAAAPQSPPAPAPNLNFKGSFGGEKPSYELATVRSRSNAMSLDSLFMSMVGFVLGIGLGLAFPSMFVVRDRSGRFYVQWNLTTIAVIVVISLVLYTAYYVFFMLNDGATPGKTICGIKVIKVDGSKLTAWDIIYRSLIGYTLSSLILGIGFLMPYWDKNRQALHDKLAKTLVVKTRR